MRYAPVLLVLASCAVPMQPDEPDAGSTPPVLDAAKDAPRESMVTSDAGFDAATDAPTESAADAGFDPKAVPGLVLWLDASKGVTQNNGSVSAWADQSGNANDAKQATAQLQPQFQSGGINGKPSIHVSGGQHFTIADSTSLQWGSGDFYIAIVLAYSGSPSTDVTTGYGLVFSKQDVGTPYSGPGIFANYPVPNASTRIGGQINDQPGHFAATSSTNLNDMTPRQFAFARNSGSIVVRLNGSVEGVAANNPMNVDAQGRPVFLGAQLGNGSTIQRLTGDYAEIIAVKGGISGADVGSIESYLQAKYGL